MKIRTQIISTVVVTAALIVAWCMFPETFQQVKYLLTDNDQLAITNSQILFFSITVGAIPLISMSTGYIALYFWKYQWKKVPVYKSGTIGVLERRRLIDFYLNAPSSPYPNIHYVGNLYARINYVKSSAENDWIDKYRTSLKSILESVHTDVETNRWLPAIEVVLNDSEYAQTFAYLTNVLTNPTYRKQLQQKPEDTNATLGATLLQHAVRLEKLDTALITLLNDMDRQIEQLVTDEMVQLSSNTFDQTIPVENTTTPPTNDQWLDTLLKDLDSRHQTVTH